MAKRPTPIEPPPEKIRPKGRRTPVSEEPSPPTFAEIERDHRRELAAQRSAKRAKPHDGPTVSGSTRAARPRSGRSGSDSDASRRTRGH